MGAAEQAAREVREARAGRLAELLSGLARPNRILVLQAMNWGARTPRSISLYTGLSVRVVDEALFDLGCLGIVKAPKQEGNGSYALSLLGGSTAWALKEIGARAPSALDETTSPG